MEVIKKGWGQENVLESNELYCMKVLQFDKEGSNSSMHFHVKKDETWTIMSGSIKVDIMDLSDSSVEEFILEERGVIRIKPMTPHKVTALQDNTSIMECSSYDDPKDNYRISPGDSQKTSESDKDIIQKGVKINLLSNP